MKLNKENIFLFDGIGACLSFLGTGFIFPLFSSQLGVPAKTLYLLASFPLIYCLYSFTCHFLIPAKKLWMLKLIMAANLFYCVFSLATVLKLDEVTSWGHTLITGEVLVILGVVWLEFKVYKEFR